MLVTRIDSGWRNVLRKVPASSVLYLPCLPEGFTSATVRDFSGNRSNGTITGATGVRRPSGLYALNFAGGDDSVDFGDPASLDITTTLSVLIWHKNAVADLTGVNVLLSKYKTVGDLREWTFQLTAAEKFQFYATDDGADAVGHSINCNSDSAISAPNAWNMYGVTYNAGTVVMYLNGASVAFTNSGTAITSLFNGTGKLIMGSLDGGANWLYGDATVGLIANTVLTPAFVRYWYQRTKPLVRV